MRPNSFNEAEAITPRNLDPGWERPPGRKECFNEAEAITPRNLDTDHTAMATRPRFNEAEAITPRNHPTMPGLYVQRMSSLQ